MANEAKNTMRELLSDIDHDFDRYNADLTKNLASGTPVATGFARRNWRDKYKSQIGKQRKYPLIENRTPYVGILDEGSSRQAPRGIVDPAIKKTRKPK